MAGECAAEGKRYAITGGGITAEVTDYGAILLKLLVPDKDGRARDVVLGYDGIADYGKGGCFFGATVGRFAGYIDGGRIFADGREIFLPLTDEKNHLHGGPCGFDKRLWTVEEAAEDRITFSRVSPDGEENYPGTLNVRVTYSIEEGGLALTYDAVCDKETVLNMTNHSYFNLNGEGSGTVLGHTLTLAAGEANEDNADGISAEAAFSVEGTPFDFRAGKTLGQDIEAGGEQLAFGTGYDHNFFVGHTDAPVKKGELAADESGIVMEVLTTQSGIQLYSGNFLDHEPGKNGHFYGKRDAVCLECQYCASAADIAAGRFLPVWPAGKPYHEKTVYRFRTK